MENFIDNAIIERIKFLRNQHSGKRGKSKFARALGISASTYSYYENKRVPPIEVLLKICEVTGATLEWLIIGQKNDERDTNSEDIGFGSEGEVELVPGNSLMRKLGALLAVEPDLAEPISAFVELLCDKKKLEEKLNIEKTMAKPAKRLGWIPVLGRTAAGMVSFWDDQILPGPKQAITKLDELVKKYTGKDIIHSADGRVSVDLQVRPLINSIKKLKANLVQVSGKEEDNIVEFVECNEIFELFPDSFALQIDGDSMSPRINDGDIVILSPSVPVEQGQIGIVCMANQIGVTCKLIRSTEQKIHLIPINERYETKVLDKRELLWSLAVLCHISLYKTTNNHQLHP